LLHVSEPNYVNAADPGRQNLMNVNPKSSQKSLKHSVAQNSSQFERLFSEESISHALDGRRQPEKCSKREFGYFVTQFGRADLGGY
jgi:hypothetical protein